MRSIRFTDSLLGPLLFSLFTVACSTDPGEFETRPGGAPGRAPDDRAEDPGASLGGGAHTPNDGETVRPPACDESAEDLPDAAHLDSNCDGIDGDARRAVFVSPFGDDEAAGSREAPLATLTRAIARATELELDVYVCSAVYEENVRHVAGGVHVYGGFACAASWGRTDVPVEIAPPSGVPLVVTGADSPRDEGLGGAGGESSSRVDAYSNFRFVAADADEPGSSSIAVSVVRAGEVLFDHTDFVAGAGADAAPAESAPEFERAAHAGKAGKNAPANSTFNGASCFYPDPNYTCTGVLCPGAPLLQKDACDDIESTIPAPWSGDDATSCDSDDGKKIAVRRSLGGSGGNGFRAKKPGAGKTQTNVSQAGAKGRDGSPAAKDFGSITAEGDYEGTNRGGDGAFGKVGKHGRGGDGATGTYLVGDLTANRIGGAGGSSGKAGCGGYPGRGGNGGGASIGLVVVDTHVELDRVHFTTDDGGRGGVPTLGGVGQSGGDGAKGGTSSNSTAEAHRGKSGTDGGKGGDGGAGAPGAGGPSVGLVIVGEEPIVRAAVFDIGRGGFGGEPLSGTTHGEGPRGLSVDQHVVVPEDE